MRIRVSAFAGTPNRETAHRTLNAALFSGIDDTRGSVQT